MEVVNPRKASGRSLHVDVPSGLCTMLCLCERGLPPIFKTMQCPVCTDIYNGLEQTEVVVEEGFYD